jgi:hypothetical protein
MAGIQERLDRMTPENALTEIGAALKDLATDLLASRTTF